MGGRQDHAERRSDQRGMLAEATISWVWVTEKVGVGRIEAEQISRGHDTRGRGVRIIVEISRLTTTCSDIS